MRSSARCCSRAATGSSRPISRWRCRWPGRRRAPDFQLPAHGVDLESLEQSLVIQALERCGGNQTRAATLLGMNRDQIRYRIEKYGLVRPQQA